MINISPSILSADFARLGEAAASVSAAGARYLHLDVMDGFFVPNISFGAPVIASLKPFGGNLLFDTHLMVHEPGRYIGDFADAGSDIITVHAEACADIAQTLTSIRAHGCKAGLSVKPGTPVEICREYAGLFDLILIMTVEPGFGGQSFIHGIEQKIKRAAALFPGKLISADGGINVNTAARAASAGADILVAGSAVFGAESVLAGIDALCRACTAERGQMA